MTHHPNTPASRNEVSKALIEALDRYMRQDETAGDTDNGVYRNAKVVMSDALSSRTEQAAPSVASGVEKEEAGKALQHVYMTLAEVPCKCSARRREEGVHFTGCHLFDLCVAIDALADILALAAPGAAIAARGQEVDEATALKGGRWVSADDIEHMTGELLSLATGDPYTPTKMIDAFHTLRAALAWQAIHEDDLSATERFIVDGGVKQAAFFPVDADRLANIALHCIREVRATRAAAAACEPCATCGASEPFTGSCGASDGDTRALCKRASRQEAPAASAEEWMPVTPEQHSKAFAAGDLMALAEEAGGARMAENVVQVTRSDIERIIYFAKDREDTAARSPATVAQPFQQRVRPWLLECFGEVIANDREERNHRFLEEALELVQACGCTASEAHQLVDYTFGRPVGERGQEVGGVMVTLAALCLAQDLDMHAEGETELARISAPELASKIRTKQAAKPKHSPLPAQPCPSQGCVLSDAQCREIYWELDKFGKEMDHYEYGLPLLQIDDREEQVFKIIRDAALSTDKGDGGSKE